MLSAAYGLIMRK